MNSKLGNAIIVGLQVLMSLAFMGSGAMKIMTPYEALKANPGMEWANDFSATAIVGIGSVELLLALGLLLSLFRFFESLLRFFDFAVRLTRSS